MKILKELPELIAAGIISEETASKIQHYYQHKSQTSGNKLYMVFGILGALLIGLGIILIIAHNWNVFSKPVKLAFAFLPLVIGQVLCGIQLLKKNSSIVWKESAAVFLVLSIGACISVISQVYNLPENIGAFFFTWAVLSLPVVYIMKSSVASLIYILMITNMANQTGYWVYPTNEPYLYWPLLFGVLPYYYKLYKEAPRSNFMVFHNWFIPLSLIMALGTIANDMYEFIYIAYFSLFGIFYIVGGNEFFNNQKLRNNSYKILGTIGSIVLLLSFSFEWFWNDLRDNGYQFFEFAKSPEFIAATLITLLTMILWYAHNRGKKFQDIDPVSLLFIAFVITFTVGIFSSVSIAIINFILLALGVYTILQGSKKDHLGLLNYGLLIIASLIVCRFFDTDLSFIIRGLLFVAVGLGFFIVNYLVIKKRKVYEN